MKRLIALAALAFLGSCSAPYSGVTIFEVCAFPTPTAGACVFSPTCANTLAGPAFLDVATAPQDFVLPIQFNNQLASSANEANGTVDANTAYIESIQIEYSGANGLAPVTVPVTITVPSAGATSQVIPLIPQSDFAKLPVAPGASTNVVMSLKATGRFLSQQSFTTQSFQIPVTVCSGCLAFNPCPPSTPTVSGVCPQLGQTNTVSCQ